MSVRVLERLSVREAANKVIFFFSGQATFGFPQSVRALERSREKETCICVFGRGDTMRLPCGVREKERMREREREGEKER